MYKYSRYLFTAIPYRTKQNRTKFQSDKILVISKDFGHSCPTNNFVCFKISIRFQFYGIQPVFFQGKNSKNVSWIVTNILFFNHNVKFRINYKFVIFFCLQVLLFYKFLYQFAKIAKN